jgi:uncharacterized protein
LIIPGRAEALDIMHNAGCSKGVIKHCLKVTNIAMRLAEEFYNNGLDVDLALVEAGALLHDLGRSKTHSIRHGVVGGELAREMGLPDKLARIIERHIGAGIPPEEAATLGLPKGNYVPETLEEKIVTYADKLIEGHEEVEIGVTLKKFAEELGDDHPALARLRALHIELEGLLEVEI